jgi:Spy/CpxP family protein refolding chaperone
MTSLKLSYLSVPLFALALTSYVATAAVAEEAMTAKPAAEAGKDGGKDGKRGWHKGGKHGGMMTADELDKLEGMSADERKAYFKQRHEEFDKLSKEEKEAKMAERKKAFEAMSDDDKKALKERNEKFRQKVGAERKKEMEDFLNTLTPEQRAKWDAMKKDKHRPWDGKKGKHDGQDKPEKEEAGEPAASDKAE